MDGWVCRDDKDCTWIDPNLGCDDREFSLHSVNVRYTFKIKVTPSAQNFVSIIVIVHFRAHGLGKMTLKEDVPAKLDFGLTEIMEFVLVKEWQDGS